MKHTPTRRRPSPQWLARPEFHPRPEILSVSSSPRTSTQELRRYHLGRACGSPSDPAPPLLAGLPWWPCPVALVCFKVALEKKPCPVHRPSSSSQAAALFLNSSRLLELSRSCLLPASHAPPGAHRVAAFPASCVPP
jgi:hypothetical protein